MANKAVVAGASGLIGSNLLSILLQEPDYDEVLILVRNELPIQHKKLIQLKVDFAHLNDYQAYINGNVIFCCLGSTRKKTPDLNVYRRIDHDYPLQLAQMAKESGIPQYHLVSSIGANVSSSNYYTKMKGEVEADIEKISLPGLHIYRPAFLTGDRKENRPAERILVPLMAFLNPLLIGKLKKYRTIAAETVAWAMYKQSLKNKEGIFIYPSDKIKELS